ncbi:MAG: anthranilate phosphoribosyltransferase [Spirochaetales bacterium]|nr:anthranilate phosphoribosyltransferase [Spirochaetales bacterium]
MLTAVLKQLIDRQDLDAASATQAMTAIMTGEAGEAMTAALLVALRCKGEKAHEVTAFVRSMRKAALVWPEATGDLCDTCGTGGDGRGTINISTLSALLLASLGHSVAKHGNRAVSSTSGSADLLEELGLKLDRSVEDVIVDLRRSRICFLFAPLWHPAMRHAAPVRRSLGIRTVFNMLGPLTNPAPVAYQSVGVFDPELLELMAEVLCSLDRKLAYVIHSQDGLDEISPEVPTRYIRVEQGRVVEKGELRPEDFGVRPFALSRIQVPDKKEAFSRAQALIRGAGLEEDRTIVAMNAALLHGGRRGLSLKDAYEECRSELQSGRLESILKSWIERIPLPSN